MNDSAKRARLNAIISAPQGVIAPGIADPMFARLVEDCGYSLVHMSGNALHKSFCCPDDNVVTITEIESRAARIADVTNLPLIVDIGTANRHIMQMARAVRVLERAGVSGIRIEDSDTDHEETAKQNILPKPSMLDKIKAFVDARTDSNLVLIARCDSRSVESLDEVQERLERYADAGADALGVQLSKPNEFIKVAQNARKPLVTLWPRRLMSAFEFLQIGVRVALLPSAIPLTAVSAVRRMLLGLKESGNEYGCLDLLADSDREQSELWYKQLGDRFRGEN